MEEAAPEAPEAHPVRDVPAAAVNKPWTLLDGRILTRTEDHSSQKRLLREERVDMFTQVTCHFITSINTINLH